MQIKRIADLCERFKELSNDFDKALPSVYRYSGQPSTGDRRADAWSNADRCIITTAAALSELEAVLREQLMLRAKPRGKPKAEVDERIGTPMYVVDE